MNWITFRAVGTKAGREPRAAVDLGVGQESALFPDPCAVGDNATPQVLSLERIQGHCLPSRGCSATMPKVIQARVQVVDENLDIDQVEKLKELLSSSFSESFRALRKAARLRQVDLAERLGVSYATVVNLEKGHTAWTEDKIARFVVALRADLPAVLRAAAAAVEGHEPPDVVDADPLKTQFDALYAQRDLPGLMRHLGELAVDWGMARK